MTPEPPAGDDAIPVASAVPAGDAPAKEAARAVTAAIEGADLPGSEAVTDPQRSGAERGVDPEPAPYETDTDQARSGVQAGAALASPVARPGRTATRRVVSFRFDAGPGFARLTLLPTLAIIAWLIPGLPLLLAGQFTPVPMLLISLPLLAVIVGSVLQVVPGNWPRDLPGRASGQLPEPAWKAWWALLGTLAVAVGYAIWQLGFNSPSVIVTRTPGAILQTGFWIAQHGSLPITQLAGAFGGSPAVHLSSIGFTQSGGAIVPDVMPGVPMLLATGFWTSGLSGGSVLGPVLSGLAVLTVGGLTGRLVGKVWAPLGALALAGTLPELYTGRDTFSEGAIQLLLFGGMCLVVDAITTGPRTAARLEQVGAGPVSDPLLAEVGTEACGASQGLPGGDGGVAERRPRALAALVHWLTPERLLALFGGLAIGITPLLSASALIYVVAAVAVAGILVGLRRAAGVAFCLGLVVGAGYALAGGYLLVRPLMDGLASAMSGIGAVAAELIVLTVCGFLLARSESARSAVRQLVHMPVARRLPGVAAAVVVLAVVGLAARRYLETVRVDSGTAVARYVAALQRIGHLPVDPTRLYSESAIYWVIWYAGLPALLLAMFGAAVLVRRCVRAALNRDDPLGAGLNWMLPLAVILGGSAAVLWDPATMPDQPWASRRLVPVVLPGVIVLATWAVAWLAGEARKRDAPVSTGVLIGASLCAGAILLPSVSASFGAGFSHTTAGGGLRANASGLAQHRDRIGELDAVRSMCSAIGRSSSVLIVDRRLAQQFSQVIRGVCGVPVGWASPFGSHTAVESALLGIAKAGRRPVVLGSRAGEVTGFGAGQPVRVLDLDVTSDPHDLNTVPGAPWPVRFVIWMWTGSSTSLGV